MKRFVIDASVAAKLLFNEEHTARAEALFARTRVGMFAPDLLWIELASVAWKRAQRGELTAEAAQGVVASSITLPIEPRSSMEYVEQGAALALALGRTVYDCVYLAAAIAEQATLVSADERFINAIKQGPLGKHAAWIGDV